jgi:4-amino-4-deoxy-L-arabinose transferase-like glycosyltransferase
MVASAAHGGHPYGRARPCLADGLLVGSLALVLRLGYIALSGAEDALPDSYFDQLIYGDLGRNLAAGRGFSLSWPIWIATPGPTALQPPLYPVVLAASFEAFGLHFLPVRLLQAVLGGITCALCVAIGTQVWGRLVGAVAGLGLALHPLAIQLSRPMMTETLTALLTATAILAAVRFRQRPSTGGMLAIGALLGLMFLNSYQAPAIVGLVPLMAVWEAHRGVRATVVHYLLPLALVFTLVVAPWVVRNYVQFGRPIVLPTKSHWNLWVDSWLRYRINSGEIAEGSVRIESTIVPNFELVSEQERSEYLGKLYLSFVRDHSGVYAQYAVGKVLAGYFVLPRELLPPPFGWHAASVSAAESRTTLDDLTIAWDPPSPRLETFRSPTSLDDVPVYRSVLEQLRLWCFRFWFVAACLGVLTELRRGTVGRERALPFVAMVLISMVGMALVRGSERYRYLLDPYLILLGAVWLEPYVRRGIERSGMRRRRIEARLAVGSVQ